MVIWNCRDTLCSCREFHHQPYSDQKELRLVILWSVIEHCRPWKKQQVYSDKKNHGRPWKTGRIIRLPFCIPQILFRCRCCWFRGTFCDLKFHYHMNQLDDKLPTIKSPKKPPNAITVYRLVSKSNHFIIILTTSHNWQVFIHCFQTKQAWGKLTIDHISIEGFKDNNWTTSGLQICPSLSPLWCHFTSLCWGWTWTLLVVYPPIHLSSCFHRNVREHLRATPRNCLSTNGIAGENQGANKVGWTRKVEQFVWKKSRLIVQSWGKYFGVSGFPHKSL